MTTVSRRSFLGLLSTVPVAACGGAGAAQQPQASVPANVAAPVATQPAPAVRVVNVLPVVYQFFGPVARQAAMRYTNPAEWAYPGSALTAATKLIRFDLGVLPIASARFRCCWTAPNTQHYARLVAADDGPSNIIQLGPVIQSNGRGYGAADNLTVDVTAAMNALRIDRVYKNVGLQLFGDGLTDFEMSESRLEVDYEVPS